MKKYNIGDRIFENSAEKSVREWIKNNGEANKESLSKFFGISVKEFEKKWQKMIYQNILKTKQQ